MRVSELGLQPAIDWAGGLRDNWQPGEEGAKAQLDRFRQETLDNYGESRDHPGVTSTSRLSPHLRFGEISPRQIWHAIDGLGGDAFLRQLGWRGFSHHMLYSHPLSVDEPLRPEFARFPWRHSPRAFAAWARGKTGYPFVDAGMRELWKTGWMHNRVRMVAASFLVKHLLIAWQEGLPGSGTRSWMPIWQITRWVGSGSLVAEPMPLRTSGSSIRFYKGRSLILGGNYVRRWIPELVKVPDAWIHKPWLAPGPILARAGVELGVTYPHPIVDHAEARRRALSAFRRD